MARYEATMGRLKNKLECDMTKNVENTTNPIDLAIINVPAHTYARLSDRMNAHYLPESMKIIHITWVRH